MSQQKSLREAALSFLASLPEHQRRESQQEINRFIEWYGNKDKAIKEITEAEIGDYAEQLADSIPDLQKKVAPVKAFLVYAKQEGFISKNLAVHLKAKKGAARTVPLSGKTATEEPVVLTSEGYEQIQRELRSLREERLRLIEEVQKARADKDIRENAPLEAAREELAQIESRLRELEPAVKSAVMFAAKPVNSRKASLGCTVVLCALASRNKVSYTLVNPREADLAKRKISIASPLGKALLGCGAGEIVEVVAPVGKLQYRLEKVE